MKILPDKITDKMVSAMESVSMHLLSAQRWEARYKAMLDASPCPWTKIEGPETLPSDDSDYLLYNGKISTGYRHFNKWVASSDGDDVAKQDCFENACSAYIKNVTHWMKKPSPPKELAK